MSNRPCEESARLIETFVFFFTFFLCPFNMMHFGLEVHVYIDFTCIFYHAFFPIFLTLKPQTFSIFYCIFILNPIHFLDRYYSSMYFPRVHMIKRNQRYNHSPQAQPQSQW